MNTTFLYFWPKCQFYFNTQVLNHHVISNWAFTWLNPTLITLILFPETLVLIPDDAVLNLIVTTTVFVLVAHEVHRITEEILPTLVPAKIELLLQNAVLLFVLFFVLVSSENFKELNLWNSGVQPNSPCCHICGDNVAKSIFCRHFCC